VLCAESPRSAPETLNVYLSPTLRTRKLGGNAREIRPSYAPFPADYATDSKSRALLVTPGLLTSLWASFSSARRRPGHAAQ